MTDLHPDAHPIPTHIPPELVRDFDFATLPGADSDPFLASRKAVRDQPDIFFAREIHGRGSWVITRHDLIREVFQNAESFSSHHNADFSMLIDEDWPLLPLESDPPDHATWRILLNPIFAPGRMKTLEAQILQLAQELVDGFVGRGEVDFVREFAEIYPIVIFLRMFGLPLDLADRFVAWENGLIHGLTMDQRRDAAKSIVGYLREIIAERRETPTDDLISYVAQAVVNGQPISDNAALGVCFLLYTAGLDTVANMLSFMMKHLAEHPDSQKILRDDPGKIPYAIEEMLRAFPIIISHRLVTRDIDFHGVQMKSGDRIVLPTMLAGRDETQFQQPDTIDFARERVNHITFAAGPHRCIGSHLARRELRFALETWLTRVPPFRIKSGEKPVTHGVGVFGVSYLPLAWDVD